MSESGNMTKAQKKPQKNMPYVIVRCTHAGVHAGELMARKGQEVELRNARRIWYWTGAASLSELAVYGSKSPSTCKIAAQVKRHCSVPVETGGADCCACT